MSHQDSFTQVLADYQLENSHGPLSEIQPLPINTPSTGTNIMQTTDCPSPEISAADKIEPHQLMIPSSHFNRNGAKEVDIATIIPELNYLSVFKLHFKWQKHMVDYFAVYLHPLGVSETLFHYPAQYPDTRICSIGNWPKLLAEINHIVSNNQSTYLEPLLAEVVALRQHMISGDADLHKQVKSAFGYYMLDIWRGILNVYFESIYTCMSRLGSNLCLMYSEKSNVKFFATPTYAATLESICVDAAIPRRQVHSDYLRRLQPGCDAVTQTDFIMQTFVWSIGSAVSAQLKERLNHCDHLSVPKIENRAASAKMTDMTPESLKSPSVSLGYKELRMMCRGKLLDLLVTLFKLAFRHGDWEKLLKWFFPAKMKNIKETAELDRIDWDDLVERYTWDKMKQFTKVEVNGVTGDKDRFSAFQISWTRSTDWSVSTCLRFLSFFPDADEAVQSDSRILIDKDGWLEVLRAQALKNVPKKGGRPPLEEKYRPTTKPVTRSGRNTGQLEQNLSAATTSTSQRTGLTGLANTDALPASTVDEMAIKNIKQDDIATDSILPPTGDEGGLKSKAKKRKNDPKKHNRSDWAKKKKMEMKMAMQVTQAAKKASPLSQTTAKEAVTSDIESDDEPQSNQHTPDLTAHKPVIVKSDSDVKLVEEYESDGPPLVRNPKSIGIPPTNGAALPRPRSTRSRAVPAALNEYASDIVTTGMSVTLNKHVDFDVFSDFWSAGTWHQGFNRNSDDDSLKLECVIWACISLNAYAMSKYSIIMGVEFSRFLLSRQPSDSRKYSWPKACCRLYERPLLFLPFKDYQQDRWYLLLLYNAQYLTADKQGQPQVIVFGSSTPCVIALWESLKRFLVDTGAMNSKVENLPLQFCSLFTLCEEGVKGQDDADGLFVAHIILSLLMCRNLDVLQTSLLECATNSVHESWFKSTNLATLKTTTQRVLKDKAKSKSPLSQFIGTDPEYECISYPVISGSPAFTLSADQATKIATAVKVHSLLPETFEIASMGWAGGSWSVITQKDLSALFVPDRWLDDQVIHSYSELLRATRAMTELPGLPKIYIYNTNLHNFFTHGGYEPVKNWAKMWKRMDAELLLIPVNIEQQHWFLISVNIGTRVICVHDSLRSADGRSTYVMQLLEYLSRELPGVEFKVEIDYFCTQQPNGCDCGVYTCMYMKCLHFGYPCIVPGDGMTLRRRLYYEIIFKNLF